MPTVTATDVQAFAHCRDARCPGYSQQEVAAVREETFQTFGDNGGDGVFTHMVERSMVDLRFRDEADIACPVCERPREVTANHRPSYQPLSGHDPLGLLNVPKFDAAAVPASVRGESDEEIEARLRAKLREERIEAKLRAELAGE